MVVERLCMTISEAYETYINEYVLLKGQTDKTIRNYRVTLNSFKRSNGNILIEELVLHHILKWNSDMRTDKLASSTINSYLCSMRCVLQYLTKLGMEVMNPDLILRPKLPRPLPKAVEKDQINKMIENVKSLKEKAFIALLFSSGCRVSELINLNLDDITDGQAIVRGKGGKFRRVRFDKPAQVLLEAYLTFRKDDLPYLFPGFKCRRMTVSNAEYMMKQASKGLNQRVTPHILRHTFATEQVKNGAPMRAIQQQLGHESISTTERYAVFKDHHLDEIFDKYHSSLI